METTSRRFDSIIRRLAMRSPRSIDFASVTSSDAVSSLCRPTSARKSCSESAAPTTASAALLRGGGLRLFAARLTDLVPECLELTRQQLDVLVGQLVLEREGFDVRRLDKAALLSSLDEGARPRFPVVPGWFCVKWLSASFPVLTAVLGVCTVRRRSVIKLSHCRPYFLAFQGYRHPETASILRTSALL